MNIEMNIEMDIEMNIEMVAYGYNFPQLWIVTWRVFLLPTKWGFNPQTSPWRRDCS